MEQYSNNNGAYAPTYVPDSAREIYRQEAERAARIAEARVWAEKTLIAGILSIVFIASGVAIISLILTFYFYKKSNRAADLAGIPHEKKAIQGRRLAIGVIVFGIAAGVTAGLVCAILAICGVF